MGTFARAVWELLYILVVQKIIKSDNFTGLMKKLLADLVYLNGIEHLTITSYNPRANRALERFNGTM